MKRSSFNEQVYQEAGEWFLEFRDGEPDGTTRAEFDQWVRRSTDHLAAYLELAAIWNEAPGLSSVDAKELIARAARDDGRVVSLNSGAGSSVRRSPWQLLLRPRALAASVAILAVGTAIVLWRLSNPSYATDIGEQRVLSLKDGSRIELNSRSKVRIHYSDRERGVELVEGQALFSVAKDPTRPFVVASGDARVRAVGTQFDVNRRRQGTVVTVVEGQVAVRDVLLSAGEQLTVTPMEIKKPVVANVANVTAWTQRQLAFDGATLPDVAEEFNRYNERQLVIRDRAALDFRISGVFSSSDPTGLIRFLRDRPGIRVVESPSKIVIERTTEK